MAPEDRQYLTKGVPVYAMVVAAATTKELAEISVSLHPPNKDSLPEVTKPSLSQPAAASPVGSSPSPPVNGGNNAKRVALPNGQPPSAARYMPREVPPRFRCQQDHKVLLKRGQPPPPSCMLLGGGAGPPPPPPPPPPPASGVNPNNNAQPASGAPLQSDSGTSPDATTGGAATSNYANPNWGPGVSSSTNGTTTNPNRCWEKVIVDGSDMDEWPCISSKDTESSSEIITDNNSASNPGSEKSTPSGGTSICKGKGSQCQTGSASNECTLGAWNSGLKPKAVQSSSPALDGSGGLGNWKTLCGQDRVSPISSSSNFNPNTNPSAWPALVQDTSSRKGTSESECGNSNAQLSTTALNSRDQQLKMENAGVNWNFPGGEQIQMHNTDGPKNENTNSLNLNSPNPTENKGITYVMGLGNPSRNADTPLQSTAEKKSGSAGSWGGVRGASGTDTVSGQSNSGNNGNNGRNADDSWKGGPVQKPNGSRSDSWDSSSRSTGGGSWNFGAQDLSESRRWTEGSKTSGVSQGDWKQSGSEELKIGEWSGPNQPNSSTGALDNQKSHFLPENQGSSQTVFWGRSSSSTGSEVGGQSTGSNHKTGSTDSRNSGSRSHRVPPTDSQVVLQNFLSRSDLDPRVLSNSGWGQTQIKQFTSWDIEESPRRESKSDKGTDGWESSATQTKNSGGWVDEPSQSNQIKSGWGEPPTPAEWKDLKNQTGRVEFKNSPGWCGRQDEKTSPSWNNGANNKDQGWCGRQTNQSWSSAKNSWVENTEPAKGSGWDDVGSKPTSGWTDNSQNEIGTWGSTASANTNSAPGWSEQPKQANSWNKQQETNAPWCPPPGSGRPSNPNWTSGPIPAPLKDDEPSGWEEPSPQSISRKMDIDDGTSAWGDPNSYNYKNVNLWDKNMQSNGQPSREQSLGNAAASKCQAGWHENVTSTTATPVDNGTSAWGKPNETGSGWGDPDDTRTSATGWGSSPANPQNAMKSSSKSVPDGWGESDRAVSGNRHSNWEEDEDEGVWSSGSQGTSSTYNSCSWGQGGKKPSSKSSLKASNTDSWINPLSKQMSQMGLLNHHDDPTGSKMDISVAGGLSDKKAETEKRMMNLGENGIMRKDRSAFRPPISKDVGAMDSGPYFEKLTLPFSNQDGCLGDEAPCSPFSPTPSYKLSPSGSTLPNASLGAIGSGLSPQNFSARQIGGHGLFGNTTQSRGMHNSPVPPLNNSTNLRAPMPPQFLSPPVSASMLKHFPANNSLNPGLFNMGPQLSPQQLAMLSQLPQIPHFQLACQLLLQQQQQQQQQQLLQNQRKFSQVVMRQQQEQQIARMVNALQQQQQRPPGMKHSPSHPSGPKQHLDNMVPGVLNVGLSDLQAKAQMPGYNAGYGSNVNLAAMDFNNMVGGKEGGTESRFKQWTSLMEGLPGSMPPDPSMHKNGAIVPPTKHRGGSPYHQFDIMGDSLATNPGPGSDSWLSAKSSPTNKLGNKSTNPSWPPGSNSSLNTSLPSPGAWPYSASDSSYIPNTSVKFDFKSSWSPDPIGPNPASLSTKMWRNPVPSRNTTAVPRPPPGLTNQKPSSPWSSTAPRLGRGWGGQDVRYSSGSTWSDGGSVRTSCWLVLHNLTPQIDGSTLRTICMQHGPLLTFHLNLTQGTALIRYSTKQEAAKAQTALHMCVLGNTTILAEFASDEDVRILLAQAQPPAPTPSVPTAGWQTMETGQNQTDPVGAGLNLFGGSTGLGQWSSGGNNSGGGDLSGASLWGPPNYSSSLWGAPSVEDSHRMGSPTTLLPGDLLGGGSDSV
ncbi:trinucleotide repeat-containing gene 6B protein [Protopterus annectens]|uniref:trinucleotide repeat-containing gene 6B protein n=1 Tax=Protopterus annectens TaxID=7888 RepID=UPI001CF9D2E2|nr:trinucleotide repeat-containing gene 6B protein [Protopterus annectens]